MKLNNKRQIVHSDLDTFFVSCERLRDSKLNGLPIIIGGNSGRGVVSSCSYESRVFGVRSAMPMRYALKLCPQARVIKGDMELYSQKSKEVTEIIQQSMPLVEKASIDEFYMDVSGMDQFFGCYKWTNELMQKIHHESGLAMSFGLSSNKTVSKIATGEGKPFGKIHIPPTLTKRFLNPLSIKKIPMLGIETYRELSRIGIRSIEQLASSPQEFMQKLFGKNGVSLWNKAQGIDHTPVVPYNERKSISYEQTFLKDTTNLIQLKALLVKMVEKTAFDMRNSNQMASIITVKIRYSNFDTQTKQMRISYTANDDKIIKVVKELFEKLYHRRMLIRLIGIRFSGLVKGNEQINLFEDTVDRVKLNEAIDKMKKRFGSHCISRAESFNAYEGGSHDTP
jgi:DNA polymerase IV